MFGINSQSAVILLGLVAVPAVVGPLLTRWAGDRAKSSGSSPSMVRGIRTLISIVWVSLVAAGLTLTLGPIPFLSTLTFTAIGGIAVTLALQTTLQNIVAGFLLQRRRFLRMRDVVLFGGITGTVVSMGLVTTVLKLDDGTLAFVSNANLLAGPLVNKTATNRLAGEYLPTDGGRGPLRYPTGALELGQEILFPLHS